MEDQLSAFASLNNLLALATQSAPAMPSYANSFPPSPGFAATQGGFESAFHTPQYKPPLAKPVDDTPYNSKPIGAADLSAYRNMILKTESGGNYQAKNKHTTASGGYQYTNGTWGRYGGYPEARLAPRAVQDAKFNEDSLRKLNRFNGDIFKMIADHMLPAQANSPEKWTQPSVLMNKGKPMRIPPVADYVRKVVEGSPYEAQFEAYLRAHGGQR